MDKPDYPLKPCVVCGGDIPPTDKQGKLLNKWKYDKRKTCGNTCYGHLHAMHRKAREPLPEPTMMDRFILGAFK